MSVARRAIPDAARRGWCPGVARPMPTGDGLLVRVHPPLGMLSIAQARAVAAGGRRFGNGHIDVTARANLQIRGVTEATRGPLARHLEAAGLGDARGDSGPQRLTLTSPLAGRDPAEIIDVPALARAIEAFGLAVPGLPVKTLVAVEGRLGAASPDADFFVFALAPRRVGVAVAGDDGVHRPVAYSESGAPAAVAALLGAFARSGRRRARDLSGPERIAIAEAMRATDPLAPPPPSAGEGGPRVSEGRERGATFQADPLRPMPRALFGTVAPLTPPAAQGTLPRRGGREGGGNFGNLPPTGLTPLGHLTALKIEAPFGCCTAGALDRLAAAADRLGADAVRLSAARGFVLLAEDAACAAETLADLADDFIVAADDPRRAVAACTGAPACASGTTPTLADAARLAGAFRPLAALGARAHLSGCAKGCAHPAPADLTLVGRGGLYGAVVGGGPADAPALHLPIGAVLERIGRAATVGLAAAFAPEPPANGCGRDGRPG